MGTLSKARLAMKTDRELRKMLVRGNRNEILLDINDDKEAEVALQDIDGDGDIDRFAMDLGGNGYFDLFIEDTDRNGIPDHIFVVKEGSEEEADEVEELAAGPELERAVLNAARFVSLVLEAKEIVAEELEVRLKDLDERVHELRKALKNRA